MIETARSEAGASFLFFAFLAGGAFIVLVEYLYPELFRRDIRHLFYFSGLGSQERNTRTDATYRIMGLALFAFSFALFFSIYLGRMYPAEYSLSLSFLGTVFLAVCVFLFVRYLVDIFLAWLFDVRVQVASVLEKSAAFRLAFGVYALAVLFFSTYSGMVPWVFSENALVWFFCLYILMYLAAMAEYLVGKAECIFYFIFYLCIAEICPVLVAWSLFKRTLA